MKVRVHKSHVFIEEELPADVEALIDRGAVRRCPRCGCVLFVGNLGAGSCLEVECRRCRLKNVLVETV